MRVKKHAFKIENNIGGQYEKTDERTLRTKQKIKMAMVKLCQDKVDFDTLLKRIFYVLNFIF
ncbi:hypothetical protein PI20285_09850 [Pediococcus inopinatus]|nr:hypothetical protein PI20285_09850 [Pediococcus inopinatus]KRN62386.1 hypothetical protein IV83_GL000264 [Pediococcus inopinatus]